MKKGVSPVVAIVLLIAIAVISAVAVWSFIGPLMGSQAVPSTDFYKIEVSGCSATLNTINIKNTGGLKISAQTFKLVNAENGDVLNESATTQTLLAGESNMSVTIVPALTAGQRYALRASTIQDTEFNC